MKKAPARPVSKPVAKSHRNTNRLATPLYEHDCPHCTFLGTVFVPMREYKPADMYKCNRSYIMRFSSNPADNSSGDHETLSFWFRTEQEVFKKKLP